MISCYELLVLSYLVNPLSYIPGLKVPEHNLSHAREVLPMTIISCQSTLKCHLVNRERRTSVGLYAEPQCKTLKISLCFS